MAIGNYLRSEMKTEKSKLISPYTSNREMAYYYVDLVSVKEKKQFYVSDLPQLINVFFNTGRSELLPSSFDELNSLVDFLKKNPLLKIEVSGHTDNAGYESDNQKLSGARAKAVGDYLVKKGIAADRLQCIGYGSTKPIAANDTEAGKQKNRRVEFRVVK